MRNDQGDFAYNIQDARAYANRAITQSIQYPQDLPTLGGPSEALNPYRSGSPYAYGTKQFYPTAVPSYSTGYADEYVDYGLNCPPAPVLNPDPVNMVSYPWPSRSKQPGGTGAIYVEPDASYAYGGAASLVGGRTHNVAAESPNFSFSGMAAQLPSAATIGTSDRMLPNPASRALHTSAANIPYGASQTFHKPSPPTTTAAQISAIPTSGAGPVGDMANAAYSHAFGASGLHYAGAATTTTASLPGHASHGHQDRVGYLVGGHEPLFSEHDPNMRTNNSTVDFGGYTYTDSGGSSIRRGSGSSSHASSGTPSSSISSAASRGSLTSGHHAYVSSDQPPDPSFQTPSPHQPSHHHQQHNQQQQQHHHHHHPHQHHHITAAAAASAAAAAVAGNTTPTTYLSDTPGVPDRLGHGHGHADSRRAVVGGRR